MKITLDKETITLSKVEEAKEFAKNEGEWIDKDILKDCASRILSKYYDDQYVYVDEVIAQPKLEVIYQLFLGFGIYAHNMVVKCWHKDSTELVSGEKVAILGFNITENVAGNVSAFVQIFGNTDSRVI